MGKPVNTLVLKPAVARPQLNGSDPAYHRLLRELERASTPAIRQIELTPTPTPRRHSRSALERTRAHCLHELKNLFRAYLSGDYQRDEQSAVSLGQINTIGELLELEPEHFEL